MRLTPRDVKVLLKEKGWKSVDLAAHWGHSIAYVSWLVNNPLDRPVAYDDAFRGLLPRSQVAVVREARHRRKPPKSKWSVDSMYPVGRVFIALDNSLGPEDGTEMAVVGMKRREKDVIVNFEILTGDGTGQVIPVQHGSEADHLSDTGQSREERASLRHA